MTTRTSIICLLILAASIIIGTHQQEQLERLLKNTKFPKGSQSPTTASSRPKPAPVFYRSLIKSHRNDGNLEKIAEELAHIRETKPQYKSSDIPSWMVMQKEIITLLSSLDYESLEILATRLSSPPRKRSRFDIHRESHAQLCLAVMVHMEPLEFFNAISTADHPLYKICRKLEFPYPLSLHLFNRLYDSDPVLAVDAITTLIDADETLIRTTDYEIPLTKMVLTHPEAFASRLENFPPTMQFNLLSYPLEFHKEDPKILGRFVSILRESNVTKEALQIFYTLLHEKLVRQFPKLGDFEKFIEKAALTEKDISKMTQHTRDREQAMEKYVRQYSDPFQEGP